MPPQKKTPTDRRPKALTQPGEFSVVKGEFRFIGGDGKTHTLPPATDGMEHLEFGEFLDALDGGAQSDALLALRLIKVLDLDGDTRQALRSLPMLKGAELLGGWLAATGPSGVSVPQS